MNSDIDESGDPKMHLSAFELAERLNRDARPLCRIDKQSGELNLLPDTDFKRRQRREDRNMLLLCIIVAVVFVALSASLGYFISLTDTWGAK